MEYPDRWVLVRWNDGGEYAVLCGWGGGYMGSAGWKRSSPIRAVEENNTEFIFTTESGNRYVCAKCAIGYTSMSFSIAAKMSDNADITFFGEESEVREIVDTFN